MTPGVFLLSLARVRSVCLLVGIALVSGLGASPSHAGAEVFSSSPAAQLFALELSRFARETLTSSNRLELFVDGTEFYPLRKEMIRRARHTIDVSTFLWGDDRVGVEFARMLVRKAKQGVRVRAVVSFYNIKKHERVYSILREGGVELLEHNPVYWGLTRVLEQSAHEKIMIVDGEEALLGGANLCDEYMIGGARRLWHDLEVRVKGPQVARIQAQFDENWNWMAETDLRARIHNSRRLADPSLIPVVKPAARIYSSPTPVRLEPSSMGEDHSLLLYSKSYRDPSASEDMLKLHVLLVDIAQVRLRILTPYLVPPRELSESLLAASRRGVRVEIVTNAPEVNDAWLARHAAYPHIERLLNGGIDVYEYGERTLHAKAMLLDEDLISTGSHNFTNRSFRYNGELNVLTDSPAVIDRMVEVFEGDKRISQRVTAEEVRARIRTWKDIGLSLVSEFLEPQI